jgi:hypothetical protein
MTFVSVEASIPVTPKEFAEAIANRRNLTKLPNGVYACEFGDRVLAHVAESTAVFKDIILRRYGFAPSVNLTFELPSDETLAENVQVVISAMVAAWHKHGGELVVLQNGDRAVMHCDSSGVVRLQKQSDFWTFHEDAIALALADSTYVFEQLPDI